jgi:hypothetical protein
MRERGHIALCWFVGLTLWAWSAGAELPQAGGATHATLQIIVHPQNPVQQLERRTVSDMFLKRVMHWPDGEQVLPVDLNPKLSLRSKFCDLVLNRPLTALRMHWQQVIFSGRGVPPPELDSEAAVIRYVLRYRGSIGYVSGAGELLGTKAVTLL